MNDPATEYAQAVVDGTIIAGHKVVQACQRHLNDLKKVPSKDYSYYFDPDKGNEVIDFIEHLPNSKDNSRLELVNFQKFIVASVFGWRHKQSGYRRFTKAVISMARKQGKTLLVAGMALYELLYESTPKFDRQIYCAANTRQQAMVAYKMIVSFLRDLRGKSPYIKKRVKSLRSEIRDEESGSYITPLSSDYNSLDGLDVLLGIVDEQSKSDDYGIVRTLETSQGQQAQGLILIISTVSEKVNAWFHETEYEYVTKLLKGEVTNDHYFCVWYEQDNEEEIQDETNWLKSNPILYDKEAGATVLERIRSGWQEAVDKDNTIGALIYYFNMWQSASSESYIKVSDWKDTEVSLEPVLADKDVYIGMDLARVGDLSAVSWIVPLEEENHFYTDSHAFVGTRGGIQNKVDRDKINYPMLQKRGLATFSRLDTGNIDDQQIVDFVDELVKKYNFNVRAICYDRYSANSIINELSQRYEMVETAQGYPTLSEPTKQFRKYVQDECISHTGNTLLEIAINNAILKQTNDAVMIDKSMYRNKIDPLAALMDAWTQAMYHDFKHTDVANNDYYINDFHF